MKRNGFLPAGTELQFEVRMRHLARIASYVRTQNGSSPYFYNGYPQAKTRRLATTMLAA